MRAMQTSMILPALLLLAACAQADAGTSPEPLPAVVDDALLGTNTFDERFDDFDAGPDQTPGKKRHRWRTVMGYGGPASFANFKISKTSIGIDSSFSGMEDGKPGPEPLGLNPFNVVPGKSLTIVARKTPEKLLPAMWDIPYYAGQITTKFSFSQRYGYFETEAILPAGKGFWPAFWLLPTTGTWPVGGEIDVFEGLGNPREIYTTLHWGKGHKQQQKKVTLPFDASKDFHSYGVGWTSQNIVWYVDRKEVMRMATPKELDRPMYLLLSFGVGGPWGGYPDKDTAFPGHYQIRRVRAWTFAAP